MTRAAFAEFAPDVDELAFDPSCKFRGDANHVCLRRDGRSVGILGEAGDCWTNARAEVLAAERERCPSCGADVREGEPHMEPVAP